MDRELALELMKMYRTEGLENFKLHRATVQHYLAFSAALLVATLLGLREPLAGNQLAGTIAFLPVLNVLVCFRAIRMCDRYYQAAIERITIVAKLEHYLGLDQKLIRPDEKGVEPTPFAEDRFLLPDRWLANRDKHRSSKAFLKEHMKTGANAVARRTFYLVVGINSVLLVIALYAVTLAVSGQ